jgi:hypothetical protein
VVACGLHDRNARRSNATHLLPPNHRRRDVLTRGQTDVKRVSGDGDKSPTARSGFVAVLDEINDFLPDVV